MCVRRLLSILLAALFLVSCFEVVLPARVLAEDFFDDEDDDDFFFDDEDEDMEFDDEEEDEESFDILKDPFSANDLAEDAIETFTSGDYIYCLTEDGNGACTLSYNGKDSFVVVPDTLDGHPVTAIGDHTFYCKEKLEGVALPAGITAIGNGAFFKCSSLKSIVIPEGVLSLAESCFLGCESLTDIVVPVSVETVGNYAFLACRRLTEISFSENLILIGQGAFQLCSELKLVKMPTDIEIGPDAFTDCSEDLEIVDVQK